MKNLTLSNIIAATHGEYHGPADILDRVIAAVTTDSRAVAAGALFAAIPGEKVDGHDFIQMAAGAGALHVSLGGPAIYHGHLETRPPLGTGAPARAPDIDKAVALVHNSVWLWLLASAALNVLAHA